MCVADVYHAYHLIREGGIKEEHIIVFHYNDIAEDPHNPFVGTVLHEHGGRDFYPGVPWDYIGTDVNSSNVLAVLAGKRQKVLYIGACHSGYLFELGYLEDKSIYEITSSNCSQPSYSTKKACEQHERRTRSVGEQFDEVKRNVTKSTVLDFGSKDLKDEKLFRNYEVTYEEEAKRRNSGA
ncbi:vacuolar-processing enzyme-like protein [Tanacetum coccineum]